MKIIFKIAKAELRTLFCSPVAWFIAIVFFIQFAYFFSEPLTLLAKAQDDGLKNSTHWMGHGMSLTLYLFEHTFRSVISNLYIYIPLLTMGLINRELNNGTIRLLYSSPIKTRQIVFGKFLGLMIYNSLLIGLVGVIVVTGKLTVIDFELSAVLSGLFGAYLLVCTYTAIGLFLSSLTNFQIIAALGTFLTFYLLNVVGLYGQKYDLIRDLTQVLSINARINKMLKGLIMSKDIIYYIITMIMFVAFTIFRMRGAREYKPWYVKASRYFLVSAAVLTVGYYTSRQGSILYWDVTAHKVNTVHPNTQKILKDLNEAPLDITIYVNLLSQSALRALPENRNYYVWDLWDPYIRFKSNTKLNYVYYYDMKDSEVKRFRQQYRNQTLEEIARSKAELYGYDFDMFLKPTEIRNILHLAPSEHNEIEMLLRYNGRTSLLRTFKDGMFWPNEEVIAASLKRLTKEVPPAVYFTTGNLERSPFKSGEREYAEQTAAIWPRTSLVNLGFDVDTLSLDNRDIPKKSSMLVVADPKSQLSELSQSRIGRYLADGGNVMFLGEPGKEAILNPVLKKVGAELSSGTLVSPSTNEMPHIFNASITKAGAGLAEEPMLGLLKVGVFDSLKQNVFGSTAVTGTSTGGFKVDTILETVHNMAWLKKGELLTDSAAPVFNAAAGDIAKERFPAIISLTRNINSKEQRIIISGDADEFSSLRIREIYFANAFYSWLDYNDFPVYTPVEFCTDTKLKIDGKRADLIYKLLVYIIPGILLLMGSLLLIRRKRN